MVNSKSLLIAFSTAMIISGLFLVSTANFSTVRASTEVTGILSSDTNWTQANSPYNLGGNVLVNQSVTLTIEPGVTVNLGDYYIMINGTLRAIGTSVSPIQFNGGEITITSFANGWNNETDSGFIIEHANTNGTPISSSNSSKAVNNTFGAAFSTTGSSLVSNNAFSEGVDVTGFSKLLENTITGGVNVGGTSTATNNTITGEVTTSGSSVVSNNTIFGSVSAGGSAIVSNNSITNTAYTGFGLSCSGYASAFNNTISGWDTGVVISSEFFGEGGYPSIENNWIIDNNYGISVSVFIRNWVGTNIPTIQYNIIAYNNVAMRLSVTLQETYGTRPPTQICNNTISYNAVGLNLTGSVNYCTITYNDIQNNSNYNLYLATSANLNATYNWWGTTNTTAISQSIYDYYEDFNLGIATYVPFLNETNPYVPALPPDFVIPELPPGLLMVLILVPLVAGVVIVRKKLLKPQNQILPY